MRAESPVDAEILRPGQGAVRVGPATLTAEEQQRVDVEVARLTSLSKAQLEATVRETLEIGGAIRLAAIEQISHTNPAVSNLISDVRETPAATSMGRADQSIDPTFPDARQRLGGKPNNTAVKLGLSKS